MALEQYNSENFSQEAELKEKMNEFKGASNEFAVDTIKNLNEAQLTNFIEKSFKDGKDERETYSEMKKNPFYPFMVQAAIDLLGSNLKTGENKNKYNDNGEIDENGKTLDEHMRDNGGIDNKYGGGTRKTVRLVQNILKIHPDGFAGPQFFAKVCSVLKKEQNILNFKVKGFDGDHPYKYGFEKFDNNTLSGWTKTDRIQFKATVYTIDDLRNLVNKESFPQNSCAVYEKGSEEYSFYNNGRICDEIKHTMGNWYLKNGKVEVVWDADKTKTVVLRYPEIKSQKTITNIEDIASTIPSNEKYTITNAAGAVQYEIFSDRVIFHDGNESKTGVRKKLESTNGVIISYEDDVVEYSQKDKLSEDIPDKQLFINILEALGSDTKNRYGFVDGVLTKGKGSPRYYTNKGRLIESVNRNLPYNNYYVREDSESKFVEAGEYKTNPGAPGGSYVIHDKYKSIVLV